MLNKYFWYWIFLFYSAIFFCVSFPSYSLNTKTLDILSMIENKQYLSASRLLEKEIIKSQDRKTKGYYALLLSQLPLDVPTKKARRHYTFMAAQWAEDIPSKKRMQLWIEAADSFFKAGELEQADRAYKQALSLASKRKAQSEKVYVLYKRAWVNINEKKWTEAFHFLRQALKEKESQLRENILSNMGQIWVESQHFKNKIPFKDLEKSFQLVSLKEQKIIIEGFIKGFSRTKKQGIHKALPLFLKNQDISTKTLNHIWSKENLALLAPCQYLAWMEKAKTEDLLMEQALSVLNTCTKKLISKKRKSGKDKKQIGKIARLYRRIQRKGIERWPLIRVYEYRGWIKEACNESLHLLVETIDSIEEKSQKPERKATLSESFRLCERSQKPPSSSEDTVKTLLLSQEIARGYQNHEGEWENILLNLLDRKIFYPAIKKSIHKSNAYWKGKDLLPMLVLSHIQDYQPEEVRSFLNLFSPKPVSSYYLDLLTAGDFLTVEELQEWLPLSDVKSYSEALPWFKKMVSEKLSADQKRIVINKLLQHFPSGKKDRQDAALFLALHYLKTDQVSTIFQHWNRLSSIFDKKKFAVDLFEKSFSQSERACEDLKTLPVSKKVNSFPLLKFIHQCCQIVNSKKSVVINKFKPPFFLRSNPLAKDFVFFSRVQNETLWLEKGISQLQKRTSKMIMGLKASITKYQKREWRLETLAKRSESLLQKQIDLFEAELGRLAVSSPHGEKYGELKNIVSQWR